MKRGAKLIIKSFNGSECGPFPWTEVREWVALGYFTPETEVRIFNETQWNPISVFPALLTTPPSYANNTSFQFVRERAREKQPTGPRAAAYLKILGCPVRPDRLNPYTACRWVWFLETLRPQLVNEVERWAADEERHGRVPRASPNDATPRQIEYLRSIGHAVPDRISKKDAERLFSGPPTDGQLRRLNFYGISLPGGSSKEEASATIRPLRERAPGKRGGLPSLES